MTRIGILNDRRPALYIRRPVPRDYMSQVALPTESSSSRWDLCDHAGCPGEAAHNGRCYLHLGDDGQAEYLAAVARGAARLTLAGLTISGAQLAAIFGAMPRNAAGNGPVIPAQTSFAETTFTDYIDAQHTTINNECSMAKAVFQQGAHWGQSRFGGSLDLRLATFREKGKLDQVEITGDARFAGLRADGFFVLFGLSAMNLDLRWAKTGGIWLSKSRIVANAQFQRANFAGIEGPGGLARLDGMSVGGTADFSEVAFPYETTLGGYSDMQLTEFAGDVGLDGCTFGSPAAGGRHLLQRLDLARLRLSGCTFYGRVSFAGSGSTLPMVLSELRVLQPTDPAEEDDNEQLFPPTTLDLTDLDLEQGGRLSKIEIEGSCELHFARLQGELEITGLRATHELAIRGTVFGYAPFDLGSDRHVALRRCSFQRGGVLTCGTPELSFSECDARQPLIVTSGGDETAAVTSLTRTNVEHFVLRNLDLSQTAFADISNLDKLRIQGTPRFARAPTPFARGRQVILDEALVRADDAERWRALLPQGRNSAPGPDPETIAATYRALRKSREDSQDEPGGSDFYYGEMEMRRMAASRWSVEKWLLSLYWLVSGYALRAWRALVALVVVLAVGGVLLADFGYTKNPPSPFDAMLTLAQVAIGLSRTPDGLTAGGTVIVISTRILCPALLALAILALRSRVKR